MKGLKLSKAEIEEILAVSPRLAGPIKEAQMAGFLSKEELKSLVTGSIQTADIADGAVNSAKIADGGVATSDIGDGQVSTAKVADGAITKPKLGIKVVSVTVAAGATSGSSAADSELAGGQILGIFPTGNQDQHIANVVLNADGSVTVTLAAAATADNTFNVIVAKP
ncbi:MAG: hypothetical protein DRI26_07465 [Chloroflexi bacterium]|nr:MAG: hypothetical protein DRI26_07465 [Chloroflexota bacterium]